jgi:gamma-glutamyltranspeptidase
VVLGDTGIGMSVRGEQFWLDKTRAAQLRPRARPRYTLTPSIVLRDGQPFMALGTPGGDNQEQIQTCTRRSSGRVFRRCTSTAPSGPMTAASTN